jgi:TRAP-type uncharacterized transport system substrate-binding protein
MRRSFLAVCSAVVLASYPVLAQEIPKPRSSGPDADPRPARSYPRVPPRAAMDATQVRRAMRETINGGLVGIISGSMDATDLGKATDLAIGLGTEGGRLRPLLIIGRGALLNVTDIVFARGVDIGIVQSDVLAALKRDPPFPGIENYLQYISKLYDEEVHILAGKEINSIEDLASKKVNFGMPDSGTHMTADVIFERLGISVETTSFPQPVALEKLRRGEISALVCVVSKPDRWFKNIKSEENLHFLSIPANKLLERYKPASLQTDDYPDLIDPDQPVPTVAVGNVLAVYNWPAGTERYRKVARFVRAFFDRLHDLQSPPYHPKWREIDVAVPVPGWTRFAAAQEWIRKVGLDTDGPTRNARVDDSDARRGTAALDPQERNALFAEFVDYQKGRTHATSSAGVFDPRQRDALFAEFVAYRKRQTHATNSTGVLDPRQRVALFAASAN